MDFSKALETLRNAPYSSLRAHSAETILTLKIISERLKVNFFPPSLPNPFLNGNPLSAPADRKEGHRTPEGPQKPRLAVPRLAQALPKAVSWLWAVETQQCEDIIISRKRRVTENRRLDDVRRVEVDKTASEKDKLLRVLALRSLALEFNDDQVRRGLKSKVEEICSQLLSASFSSRSINEGRGGRVADFVKRKVELTSKELITKAINSGVKHLVFEELFKCRLEQLGLPGLCEAISVGFALSPDNFKTIRYDEMPVLIEQLLTDGLLISPRNGDGIACHLLDVLRWLNPWFRELQFKYILVISSKEQELATPETSSHTRKRARTASHGKEYRQSQPASSSSANSANVQLPARYRPILPAGPTSVSPPATPASAIFPAAQLDPFEPQATMGQQRLYPFAYVDSSLFVGSAPVLPFSSLVFPFDRTWPAHIPHQSVDYTGIIPIAARVNTQHILFDSE